MSQGIEQIILANTAALEANTAATLSLVELMKAAGAAPKAASDKAPAKPDAKPAAKPDAKPAAKPAAEEEPEDPADVVGPQADGSVFYSSVSSQEYGSFPTLAKFNAAKKKNKDLFIISANSYAAKVEADDEGGEEGGTEHTLDDLIAVFSGFISKDLDADLRKERHAFAKDLLGRLGAEKASAVEPKDYGLVIATLTSVVGGEEVDLDEVFAGAGAEEEEDGLI